MKQTMKKMKTGVIVMATALASLTGPSVFASDSTIGNPIELKYIGNEKNQPVFQLDLNNTEIEEFIISVRDIYGNVLYSEKVKGEKITKRFRLNTDEVEMDELKFEVISKKTNKTSVYEVTRNTRLVQDVVVNKL